MSDIRDIEKFRKDLEEMENLLKNGDISSAKELSFRVAREIRIVLGKDVVVKIEKLLKRKQLNAVFKLLSKVIKRKKMQSDYFDLWELAKSGDFKKVKSMCKKNMYLDVLCAGIVHGNSKIINFYKKKVKDLRLPLYLACYHGDLLLVKEFIKNTKSRLCFKEKIYSFFYDTEEFRNPLNVMASDKILKNSNTMNIIKELGKICDYEDIKNAIAEASIYSTLDILEELIVLLDNKNKETYTEALTQAAEQGKEDFIEKLIPLSIPLSTAPLYYAARTGHLTCVEMLIPHSDAQADDSAALIAAAENGYMEIVKLLIPHSNSKNYMDALKIAANEEYDAVVKEIMIHCQVSESSEFDWVENCSESIKNIIQPHFLQQLKKNLEDKIPESGKSRSKKRI